MSELEFFSFLSRTNKSRKEQLLSVLALWTGCICVPWEQVKLLIIKCRMYEHVLIFCWKKPPSVRITLQIYENSNEKVLIIININPYLYLFAIIRNFFATDVFLRKKKTQNQISRQSCCQPTTEVAAWISWVAAAAFYGWSQKFSKSQVAGRKIDTCVLKLSKLSGRGRDRGRKTVAVRPRVVVAAALPMRHSARL